MSTSVTKVPTEEERRIELPDCLVTGARPE